MLLLLIVSVSPAVFDSVAPVGKLSRVIVSVSELSVSEAVIKLSRSRVTLTPSLLSTALLVERLGAVGASSLLLSSVVGCTTLCFSVMEVGTYFSVIFSLAADCDEVLKLLSNKLEDNLYKSLFCALIVPIFVRLAVSFFTDGIEL